MKIVPTKAQQKEIQKVIEDNNRRFGVQLQLAYEDDEPWGTEQGYLDPENDSAYVTVVFDEGAIDFINIHTK